MGLFGKNKQEKHQDAVYDRAIRLCNQYGIELIEGFNHQTQEEQKFIPSTAMSISHELEILGGLDRGAMGVASVELSVNTSYNEILINQNWIMIDKFNKLTKAIEELNKNLKQD